MQNERRISLIVTDSGPLIALAVAGSLDALLMPKIKVVIPDMVRYEVVRNPSLPGAEELLNWVREHEPDDVIVESTSVFEEYVALQSVKPDVRSKSRGEQSASEILQRELQHNVEAAILLFEDGDVIKDNFLVRLPDNVLIMSTASFLYGLESANYPVNTRAILEKAVQIRGDRIFHHNVRHVPPDHEMESSWTKKMSPK